METFSAWLERKGLEEQPILNTWEFKPPKKKKKKKLKRTRCVADVGSAFAFRADGQLGADGQLHIIFEQVQNRFHWNKALGGRLFCHLGKTVTPYSL